MKDLEEWHIFNDGKGMVALRNPKTDKVLKLSLAVHQAMGEIGNSLSRWCSLLVATFDMSVEVASVRKWATSHMILQLQYTRLVSNGGREKRITYLGFLHGNLYLIMPHSTMIVGGLLKWE